MIGFPVLTTGLGKVRWLVIIAASVLVAIVAEYLPYRESADQTRMIAGFFAGMSVATITATVRAFMEKTKDDGKKG